jgi:hypothetical protein
MIVPTSAKVGIAGFLRKPKAQLQKCNRAFFIAEREIRRRTVVPTVHTPRNQLQELSSSIFGEQLSRFHGGLLCQLLGAENRYSIMIHPFGRMTRVELSI